MHRLVLIVLMCLLPLQWSWAAAARICAHEADTAHFGHHEHRHGDPRSTDAAEAGEAIGAADAVQAADAPEPAHGAAPGDAPGGDHPDCTACHGLGVAFPSATDGGLGAWSPAGALPAYGHVLPDPPVESFLRPPLVVVA